MMPRLLLICYYFPPMGGAGVGRPLALFRSLKDHGIDCGVLTVKDVAYRVFEPELLHGLDETRIHRAGSRDPQRLLRLLGVRKVRASRIGHAGRLSNRFFPDPKIGWVAPAVRLARKLIRENRYTAMLSTSPPISGHLVAQAVQVETGLPWVADFRDFWTSRRIEDDIADASRRERAWELIRSIQGSAVMVTTCNPAISEYLGGGEVIYHGYDDKLAQRWRTPSPGSLFNIGLLGTFDELVPVEPLLKVLAVVRNRAPQLLTSVRLLQVGQVDPGWMNGLLDRYSMRDIGVMHGFQSRRRTVEILNEASLFYFALASSKECGASRVYDMLVSGRPILAGLPPDSVVAETIVGAGVTDCFDPHNAEDIERAAAFVEHLIRRHHAGELSITPRPDYARPFSASAMVAKFADVIHGL